MKTTVVKSRIPAIAAELSARGDEIARHGAEKIRDRAKERVHYGRSDPHLRDAIHEERQSRGVYAVIAGDNQVFYGHMVEHGTSHSAPHPFLVPALEESAKGIEEDAAIMLRGL